MDLNKILVWNCRRAASTDLFRNCKQYIDVHHPEIFALIETRCNPARLKKTFRLLGYDGFTYSENRGFAGGIGVGWKIDAVSLLELKNDFQFIHFNVMMQDSGSWFLSFVYASPVDELQTDMWSQFITMAASMQDRWLVVGDFNDIVGSHEKKGGGPLNTRKSQLFQTRIHPCNFIDLGSVGTKFTWRGSIYGTYDRTFARLDRGMCNAPWRISFLNAYVKVLPRWISQIITQYYWSCMKTLR